MGGVLLHVRWKAPKWGLNLDSCAVKSLLYFILCHHNYSQSEGWKAVTYFLVSHELHPTVHVFPRMLAERRPRLPAVVRGNEPAIFPWTVSVFSGRTEIAAEKRGVVSAWSHVNYTWWKHRIPKIRMHWHDMGHAVHIHVLSTPSAQLSWILLRNSCIFCQRP